jgi:hypothetical protein
MALRVRIVVVLGRAAVRVRRRGRPSSHPQNAPVVDAVVGPCSCHRKLRGKRWVHQNFWRDCHIPLHSPPFRLKRHHGFLEEGEEEMMQKRFFRFILQGGRRLMRGRAGLEEGVNLEGCRSLPTYALLLRRGTGNKSQTKTKLLVVSLSNLSR